MIKTLYPWKQGPQRKMDLRFHIKMTKFTISTIYNEVIDKSCLSGLIINIYYQIQKIYHRLTFGKVLKPLEKIFWYGIYSFEVIGWNCHIDFLNFPMILQETVFMFWTLSLEKTPENTMDSHKKQTNTWIIEKKNQLTCGTNG